MVCGAPLDRGAPFEKDPRKSEVCSYACAEIYFPDEDEEEAPMDTEEAKGWLRGNRSMTNIIPHDPVETWQVRIAKADAAMMQQAYLVLKAYKEAPDGD
jgi:hypothetical protein